MGGSLMDWIHGGREEPIPDSPAFRLHYKTTVVILFSFGISLGLLQVFSQTIQCKCTGTSTAFANSFCWSKGLKDYVPPKKTDHNEKNTFSYFHGDNDEPSKDARSLTYIRGLPLLFILQSFLFYVPRYFWKVLEGGTLRRLSQDIMQSGSRIGESFFRNGDSHFMIYTLLYIAMEIMNIVNALANGHYIDRYLDGNFWAYGQNATRYNINPLNNTNPSEYVFPSNMTCNLKTYGSSGVIQIDPCLCLFQWTYLLEAMVLFIWVWLIFLTLVSILSVLFHIAVYFVGPFRHSVLKYSDVGAMLPDNNLNSLAFDYSFGVCFLFRQLSDHVPISRLAKVIEEMTGHQRPPQTDTFELLEEECSHIYPNSRDIGGSKSN